METLLHSHSGRARLLHLITEVVGKTAPRYTSYPPATKLSTHAAEQCKTLLCEEQHAGDAIALYGHIPYCKSLCYFCACNRVVTGDYRKIQPYLDALKQELRYWSPLVGHRPVASLHLGGGTPNFLAPEDLRDLLSSYQECFNITSETHLSVELDPRTCSEEHLKTLADFNCQRVSIGVQDFDLTVQKRINRIQSFEATRELLQHARTCGIAYTGVDIIYGLPLQTLDSFAKTLDSVIELSPDRIALYGYAHVTTVAPGQRIFSAEELPDSQTRFELLYFAYQHLVNAGYSYLGLDHFVKPTDPLNLARISGNLGRNFMGYHPYRDIPLVATGASGISIFPHFMSQNVRNPNSYIDKIRHAATSEQIDASPLQIEKGYILSTEDQIIARVINQILSYGKLDKEHSRASFGAEFDSILNMTQKRLSVLEELGLIRENAREIELTLSGRFFARIVAGAFDTYQREFEKTGQNQPSSLII